MNDSNKQSQLSMEEPLDNNINLVVDEPVEINQSNQNKQCSTVKNSATTTVIFDFNSMRVYNSIGVYSLARFFFYHFQILK